MPVKAYCSLFTPWFQCYQLTATNLLLFAYPTNKLWIKKKNNKIFPDTIIIIGAGINFFYYYNMIWKEKKGEKKEKRKEEKRKRRLSVMQLATM